MLKNYFILIAALLLAGCATPNSADDAKTAELRKPFICKDKAECDLYWQRSQIWLSSNSGYKIQIANDTIIQTYGPLGTSPTLAFTLTKIPLANGSAQIKISAGCNNIFGCSPNWQDAYLNFRHFVRAGS